MLNADQYPVVAERRLGYDNLLWQTPVLSLTAQAFLFAIAFGAEDALTRLPASLLVVLVAAASLQLMAKHRAHEKWMSRMLEEFERATPGFAVIHSKPAHGRASFWVRQSSYTVWMLLMWCFLAAGCWATYRCIDQLRAPQSAKSGAGSAPSAPPGP
jgi:hypothetical protein